MKQKLIDYFSSISPLSEAEAKAIHDSAVVKEYEKNTVLLKEGQITKNTYFVFRGLIRQYSLVDGEEKTAAFFTENQWVISLTGLNEEKVSTFYWVCEEDCVLLIGNDNSAQDLFKSHPRLESIARKIVENTFAEYQQTMMAYLNDTPEQRYLRLIESRPDLIQRIPQYQLASYLGVKPESLSRIRKRLALKR
ncbi:MAG: Crp/Fnr family transcriptional regulator [Emticicia sp.]|uniref:Crp/Fnr family transcriptional regulator n=1 Tax=Emticicia sp. TaxID=1930953 RepID=UPI003BA43F50